MYVTYVKKIMYVIIDCKSLSNRFFSWFFTLKLILLGLCTEKICIFYCYNNRSYIRKKYHCISKNEPIMSAIMCVTYIRSSHIRITYYI